MKILKVIHGYPERYNAGSEVYSQNLCHGLINQGHEVIVFSRYADAYKKEYTVQWEEDSACPKVKLCLINAPHGRDGYRHSAVDIVFARLLTDYKPDLIHIGHLSHLSTSLVEEAHKLNVPIVFTLHDFWLMCPRGQFLQDTNAKEEDLYPVCDSQQNEKCARKCYSRYFSSQEDEKDLSYWTSWVEKRMIHAKEISSYVDLFIAPSYYLMERFINDFPLDPSQICYLDYGFNRMRLKGRKRQITDEFVFGYIGTHKQAKGILHLLQAFEKLEGNISLKIWGDPFQPFTNSLKNYVSHFRSQIKERIHWMEGYQNERIIEEVFNHVDAIVVPSIWGENSPLVIHEALEAKVPVITANYGGMKEYIHHEVNGLLFEHRNVDSLAEQMSRFIASPALSIQLARRGYIQSEDGHIPDISQHVKQLESLYLYAIQKRRERYASKVGAVAHHV